MRDAEEQPLSNDNTFNEKNDPRYHNTHNSREDYSCLTDDSVLSQQTYALRKKPLIFATSIAQWKIYY